jgi:hypothetical protein
MGDGTTSATPHPSLTSDEPKSQKPPPDPNATYAAKMKKRGWTELTEGLWGTWGPSSADTFSVTWKMRVVSPTGCSNGVYLEANVMDASDTVVSFTNDMLPSLPANQQAVLQLTTTAHGQVTVQITKASCY